MRITWDTLSQSKWYDIYKTLPRTHLVQSYPYAKAARECYYQPTRFGHITDENEKTLGLVQMQDISLLKLIHRVIIDCGPLWCDGADTAKNNENFWHGISGLYPNRIGRKRRFIPLTEHKIDLEFQRSGDGYHTIWLDLTPDLDTLRKGLHGKWRNMLVRAEEEGLHISLHKDRPSLDLLLSYEQDARREKGYFGPGPKFIQSLHKHGNDIDYGFTVSATTKVGTEPCAMMYIFVHGTSATYVLGYSDDRGRKTRAHYAMMWHVIQHLKSIGIAHFDLGGIQPELAEGVTKFKKRIGGDIYQTIGMYR